MDERAELEEKLKEIVEEAEREAKWDWDDFVDHLSLWFHIDIPADWRQRVSLVFFMLFGLAWSGWIGWIAFRDLAPYFPGFLSALRAGSSSLIYWPIMLLFWLGVASPGLILFFLGWKLLASMGEELEEE